MTNQVDRGWRHIKHGQHLDALALFEAALKSTPSDIDAWCGRSGALSELMRFQEALDAAEQAIRLRRDEPRAWFFKGEALYGLNRLEASLSATNEALRLDPETPQGWHNKGSILFGLNRFAEALAAFNEELRIGPSPSSMRGRCMALNRLGQFRGALEACEKALVDFPDDPQLWGEKGFALNKTGNFGQAVDAFERALEISPRTEWMVNMKKESYWKNLAVSAGKSVMKTAGDYAIRRTLDNVSHEPASKDPELSQESKLIEGEVIERSTHTAPDEEPTRSVTSGRHPHRRSRALRQLPPPE